MLWICKLDTIFFTLDCKSANPHNPKQYVSQSQEVYTQALCVFVCLCSSACVCTCLCLCVRVCVLVCVTEMKQTSFLSLKKKPCVPNGRRESELPW